LAWITGADVYVDKLDKTFAESMDALQQEYKKMYPRAPFQTKLTVNKLVENKYVSNNTALLFSGGLDSTYSLFSNISLHPTLIMILGAADIPLSNVPFQEIVKTKYSNFAKRERLNINFIRTNALEILNKRRVDYLFWRFQAQLEADFWQGLGYSFGHICQAAPLSIERFNHLLIAASVQAETKARTIREHPDASSPNTDEKMTWANLQVRHDGCIHRYEKVFALRKFFDKHRIILRVCNIQHRITSQVSSHAINCSKCEKCFRTIIPLILANIDPRKCGFIVDKSTFKYLRKILENEKIDIESLEGFWFPIKDMIPEKINSDLYGFSNFLEWFRSIDIRSSVRDVWVYRDIYNKLPFPLAKVLDELYKVLGIKIHEPSPVRRLGAHKKRKIDRSLGMREKRDRSIMFIPEYGKTVIFSYRLSTHITGNNGFLTLTRFHICTLAESGIKYSIPSLHSRVS